MAQPNDLFAVSHEIECLGNSDSLHQRRSPDMNYILTFALFAGCAFAAPIFLEGRLGLLASIGSYLGAVFSMFLFSYRVTRSDDGAGVSKSFFPTLIKGLGFVLLSCAILFVSFICLLEGLKLLIHHRFTEWVSNFLVSMVCIGVAERMFRRTILCFIQLRRSNKQGLQ